MKSSHLRCCEGFLTLCGSGQDEVGGSFMAAWAFGGTDPTGNNFLDGTKAGAVKARVFDTPIVRHDSRRPAISCFLRGVGVVKFCAIQARSQNRPSTEAICGLRVSRLRTSAALKTQQ